MATLRADGQCRPKRKQKQRQKSAVEKEWRHYDCHDKKNDEQRQNEIKPVDTPTNAPVE